MRGTIKMGGPMIWIAFVITAQFSAVLGRNSFYEYYYSRYHHKGHSTTAGLSSSTTGISADISDISSEEKTASSSVSGDTSLENLLHSSTVDLETTVHKDTTLLGYGSGFDNDDVNDFQYLFAMRVGIIVGCFVVVLIGSCCLFFCIRMCRRRNAVRSGFVISNNTQGIANEAGPQQHVGRQLYQQPVVAQQYPPQHQEERQQLFPPQYPLQPGQNQYSPMLQQGHNPPEAPPPYEFPEKF